MQFRRWYAACCPYGFFRALCSVLKRVIFQHEKEEVSKMVAISLQIEGQMGLTWPRWKRLVAEIEALGFAGLYRSDHFTNPFPPDEDSLELIVALTYLAGQTQRVRFGPLVAPLSFRHPVHLVRQAAALDDLSGGRMILGVGAGWEEREHQLFGFDLLDIPTRFTRLQEGLEVITRLLHSSEPVTYEGRFFQLRGATLLPRPQRAFGPPILIGGNGRKRTLPLVARYADIWNGQMITPSEFQEHSARLDVLLAEVGRPLDSVRRTLFGWLHFGQTMEELDQVLSWRHEEPELADKSLDEVIEVLRTPAWWSRLVGTPEMLVEQIRAYADAGVEELILLWFDQDNIEALRGFAESVLPRV
jgi:F420-dependent oxidoreductase-like protein